MTKNNNFQKGEIAIYRTKQGPEIRVKLKRETVWLKQEGIAKLFNRERSVVTKHINNIFSDKEVDKKSNVQFLHVANSDKPVKFYSLDVILAVGYRVNSARAIHFRKWATNVLKRYLIEGYAINKDRLLQAKNKFRELQATISFLQEKSKAKLLSGQEKEILNLLASYSKTLKLLNQYDEKKIKLIKKSKAEFILKYEQARRVIREIKKELAIKKQASDLFGQENNKKLAAILGNIYQTFQDEELYKSLEEKASHLLYFIIKDHPFVDGNKRIASFLFIYFLDKNNFLYQESGERKINDNALTALTLLLAVSNPKDKKILVKIITNLLG